MNDKFKEFPLCINCKYFMEEKTGPLQVIRNCGLTMIDPVTGELVPRRHRQAAAYRKENNPCGPAGLFFKPKDGKKVQPKKKEVVREAPKESQAKVVKVEVPEMVDVHKPEMVDDDYRKDYEEGPKYPGTEEQGLPELLSKQPEPELLPIEEEAPKRRKNRKK